MKSLNQENQKKIFRNEKEKLKCFWIYKTKWFKKYQKGEILIPFGSTFIPTFDDTDHFLWRCSECKHVARVVAVKRNDYYAKKPTIYFYLYCPKCKQLGQRKIYLTSEK